MNVSNRHCKYCFCTVYLVLFALYMLSISRKNGWWWRQREWKRQLIRTLSCSVWSPLVPVYLKSEICAFWSHMSEHSPQQSDHSAEGQTFVFLGKHHRDNIYGFRIWSKKRHQSYSRDRSQSRDKRQRSKSRSRFEAIRGAVTRQEGMKRMVIDG